MSFIDIQVNCNEKFLQIIIPLICSRNWNYTHAYFELKFNIMFIFRKYKLVDHAVIARGDSCKQWGIALCSCILFSLFHMKIINLKMQPMCNGYQFMMRTLF